MNKYYRLLFTILMTHMLISCTSVPNDQAYLEQYEADYKAAHPYIIHQIARNDGHKIHAREFGRENRNNGTPILLMHGFPDSLHLYDQLIPLLAKERQVIAFDFLGWGCSDKPDNHNYNAVSLTEDVDAVVHHFELIKSVIVLHDLSGIPGIDWALAHEEKTGSLILLNTIYAPSKAAIPPEAIKRFSTPGIYRDVSVFFTRHFDSMWYDGFTEQVTTFYANPEANKQHIRILTQQSYDSRNAFYSANQSLIEEINERKAMIPSMRNFKRPTCIIFGNDDPTLNPGVAKEFDAIFPNSKMTLIQGAKHYVQIDQPVQVAEKILTCVIP